MDKHGKAAKEQPLTTINEVPTGKKGHKIAGGNVGPSPRLSIREEERKDKLNQTQPVKLKEELLGNGHGKETEGRPQIRPKAAGISGIQVPRSRGSNIPAPSKQKNGVNMSVDMNVQAKLNNSALAPQDKLNGAGLLNKTVGGVPPTTVQTPKLKAGTNKLAQMQLLGEKKISTPSGKAGLKNSLQQTLPGPARP